MTIQITIENTGNVASIDITKEGKKTTKKVNLVDLSEAFQSLTAAEKDTGYLSSHLLREVVKNTVIRAYYFKEYITDFKYSCRTSLSIVKNKYNIELRDEDGTRTLIIPEYKFTNILGFINNSNTEAFNPSFYQIYHVVPNIFGKIDGSSKYARFFPNQFDSYICWASSFNHDILKNKDPNIQSAFVPQYLSSRFNRDLFRENFNPRSRGVENYSQELDEFFREVSNKTSLEVFEQDQVGWFYLFYFFLVKIKQIEPASLKNSGSTLNQLFSSRL